MASQPSTAPSAPTAASADYLQWSRDPAVALLSVVPLWLIYEGLRFDLAPAERNGAEALVSDGIAAFGPRALLVVKVLLGLTVIVAAIVVWRRKLPWARIAGVSALEGTVYGFLLGPLTQILMFETGALALRGTRLDPIELVGSLGAGVFEEAVFRLLFLSLLALIFVRAVAAFGMPRALGVAVAIGILALVFSWFHHVGRGGEPFQWPVFLFRAVAGALLGLIFVVRGFAVVVYCHASYDVYYFLTHG